MVTKVQGAILAVSTAEAAADLITAATAANPVVLTSTAHGITNGSIIRVTGAGGMAEINDRAFVADAVATNTLNLKGINGTAYTAFTSGGSIFAQTMTPIGKCDLIGPGFNGQAPKIDTTHLRSRGREFQLGIPDFGDMPVGLFDETDAGQTRLQALHESGAVAAFSISLPDGRVAAFLASVMQYGFDAITPDTVFKSQIQLAVTNYPSRFV